MDPEEHKPDQESTEEIINALKANNPDVCFDALIEFVQHEIQHKKEKPLKNQGFTSGDGGIRTLVPG